jgi:tetratricopeptide (TPR) repeat protein
MADLEELDKNVAELKKEGKYIEALDLLEQGLTIRKTRFGEESEEVKVSYKQLCELCNILATFYMQREDSHLALDLLKRAEILAKNDNHAQAITFNNLSCYYRKANQPSKALGYLKTALVLEQDIPNTHLNLCAVYSQIGKHDSALSYAMQAVIILQESVLGVLDDEIKVKELAPVLVVAYHNMAVELEYLKRNSEALMMYGKAVKFAEEYLGEGHAVIENVKSVYQNALREEAKRKKKLKGKKQEDTS